MISIHRHRCPRAHTRRCTHSAWELLRGADEMSLRLYMLTFRFFWFFLTARHIRVGVLILVLFAFREHNILFQKKKRRRKHSGEMAKLYQLPAAAVWQKIEPHVFPTLDIHEFRFHPLNDTLNLRDCLWGVAASAAIPPSAVYVFLGADVKYHFYGHWFRRDRKIETYSFSPSHCQDDPQRCLYMHVDEPHRVRTLHV